MPKGDYRPISLADGVKDFLEATEKRHNGRGFDDLKAMLEQGLNVSNIGLAFNYKSWKPADNLIRQYYAEGFGSKAWRKQYKENHEL